MTLIREFSYPDPISTARGVTIGVAVGLAVAGLAGLAALAEASRQVAVVPACAGGFRVIPSHAEVRMARARVPAGHACV